MDKVNAYMNKFDSQLELLLHRVTKPRVVRAILYILIQTGLILYVTQFAHKLPQGVLNTLNNDFFKLFILTLVLWTARFSPSISIMVALAFILTVNRYTTGKYWEMMENIASTADQSATTPVGVTATSTSVDTAVQDAATTIQSQMDSTPVVSGVSQLQETITITPSIVNTTEGPVVVNPSIVVAPAIVATPSGETITVAPNVQTLTVSPVEPEPQPQPTVESPQPMAIEPAAVAAAAPVVPVAIESAAPVTTESAAPVTAAEPASFNQTGCFPVRRVDMTNVLGTSEEGVGAISDYAPFFKV